MCLFACVCVCVGFGLGRAFLKAHCCRALAGKLATTDMGAVGGRRGWGGVKGIAMAEHAVCSRML